MKYFQQTDSEGKFKSVPVPMLQFSMEIFYPQTGSVNMLPTHKLLQHKENYIMRKLVHCV